MGVIIPVIQVKKAKIYYIGYWPKATQLMYHMAQACTKL